MLLLTIPKRWHSHSYFTYFWGCFWFEGVIFIEFTPVTEKAMAPHSSTLAWKIPWMEEPGRLQFMGSLRVGHDWGTSLSLFTFMHWRRKWPSNSSVLAWRIPGTEKPGGLPPMGSHTVGHDWSDLATSTAHLWALNSNPLSHAWPHLTCPLTPVLRWALRGQKNDSTLDLDFTLIHVTAFQFPLECSNQTSF